MFDGIAIYNLLNKHPAKVTVQIDGLAASMASVIAMAGDRIVMPENALMMIHKPWGISGGNANDMRDYAELLDKVESVLTPAYARKTGKSAKALAAMLEYETWMDGRECVAQGFADELLPAVSAMAEYGKEYYKRKTKQGLRSNFTLHEDSEDWMPSCAHPSESSELW